MAEFKLGRIRFVWKNNWVSGTTYYKDDIVHYGGRTYLCVVGHDAAVDFYTDLENVPTKWNQFTDGQVWKGNWAGPGTLYKENDIVKYGGYIYIANNGHTSQATLELDQGSWDLFAESFDWKSNWVAGTVYKVNDIVKYGGYTYLCNHAHTAAATDALGLEDDQGYWDIFSKGFDWKYNWVAGTRYKVGDVVKYGGQTYVCNLHHTAAATDALGLEADQGSWDYFNKGFEYKGQWIAATRYKVNDLVKNGGGIWICTDDNTSTASFTADQGNWAQYVEGIEFENDWVSTSVYQNGDIVRYGGNSYIAKTAHDASALTPPSSNTTDWDLFATGFRFVGDWNSGTLFKVGEIVRNGGVTYLCTLDSLNHQPPNASYWTVMNEGIKWKGNWTNGTAYVLGDTVKDGAISYICVLAHTAATLTNKPTVDVLGTYWNALTTGNESDVLTTTGDLVFYGGAGATRLPVGEVGQVLSVSAYDEPEWKYFGRTKKVYYVAPHGTNSPAPNYGLTIDQPWANVRYALEQVAAGTENPNAAYLLKMNRTFIQAEVTEWVNYHITLGTGIWSGFTNDNSAYCQRDTGLIVDAIVYDLTHTGNAKTIEAAEAYFTALGVLIPGILDEYEQDAAAYGYIGTLITNILSNTAPSVNYQTTNGIATPIKQIIDTNYTAESTADADCQSLLSIVTTALSTQSLDSLPVLDSAGYTVNVKTGQYYEVLPMRLPPNTAVVGDELRGTRVSPQGKVIPTNDKNKSVLTLQHIQNITGDIITNTTVTPTTGNGETQVTTKQKAGTGTASSQKLSNANVLEMKEIIVNGDAYASSFVYPTPTGGTGNAYTAGYLNAARLILANKTFIEGEITAKMVATYGAVWTGLSAGQKAACTRDIGYIVDALVYDLTYGGNMQTTIAARAYYSNGSFVEASGEKTAALGIQAYLKTFIDDIVLGTTAWGKLSAGTQDTSGTAGSPTAAAAAQDLVQTIYDTINTGIVPGAKQTSFTALQGAKTVIATKTTNYITATYPSFSYTVATCARDIGLIIDAVSYDLVTGSNFASQVAGAAYARSQSSVVTASQKTQTLAAITYAGTLAAAYVDPNLQSLVADAFTRVYNILNTGIGAIVTYTWPANGSTTATTIADAALLQTNRATMITSINSWLLAHGTYGAMYSGLTSDQRTTCQRDVGYMIDAITYDLQYGGTYQSVVAGAAYYSFGTLQIASGEKAATVATLTQLATLMKAYTSAGGDTTVDTLTAIIAGIINTGTKPTISYPSIAGEPAITTPDTSWVSANLLASGNALLSAKPDIQVEAIEFLSKKYPELSYNSATCARDVGYIVEAIAYDAMFASNYMSIKAGMSYNRALTSTGIVLASQKQPTLDLIDFIYGKAQREWRLGTIPSSIINNAREIKDIAVNGIENADTYSYPDPTGYDTNWYNGRRLLLANKAMIKDEVQAYMIATYSSVWTAIGESGQAACTRDIGYIVDAIAYDMTYGAVAGCNLATQIAARSYYSKGTFVEASTEKTAALAVQAYFKTFIDNVILGTTGWGKLTSTAQDTSGTPGNAAAAAFAQALVQEMYDCINTGTTPVTQPPSTTWVDATKVAANTALQDLKTTIQSDAVQYIKREYPTLNFDETLCSRDVGYIVDALGYDMMFGGNFLSIQSGMSYRRALTSTNTVVANQLAATATIIDFIGKQASYIGAGNAVTQADLLWGDIISYVNCGLSPIVVGTNRPTTDLTMIYSGQNLILNKTFLEEEAKAFIAQTFKTTISAVTGGGTNTITCSDTSWMQIGDEIQLASTFGGMTAGVSYYVSNVVDSLTFQVSDTLGGSTKNLTNASGSVVASYTYDIALCKKDIGHYVEGIAYDLMYTGNYKSLMNARYYRNALTGSKLEDFYYVANGGGIRNMTLTGLDGTSDGNTAGAGWYPDGMYQANSFGTRRPVAGAYTSLDPGWGPNDSTAWVTDKSTYVQNVTTFGTGCTGQKIDGSIHSGGLDSMVSNDFTQVLSAGIGAWVTNLGRVELVSIFTYYGHIGYLAENGGKIRATNGNNSYGDYGSVAEGVDIKETPVTGFINNRGTEADVRSAITNGTGVLVFEYGNAGSDYTLGTYSISGAGYGAAAVGNEIRDAGVFQVRLTDPGDSSGAGGTGYIQMGNVAQTGNTTSITLAVADSATSAAYVGMAIYLTAGTGAGQYGYIYAYNAATKVATIYNETTGTAGWEHLQSGTTIASTLDGTTQYMITPRLSFTAPPYSSTATTLPSSVAWKDVTYGAAIASYSDLSASGSVSGSLGTFDVSIKGGVYTVSIHTSGIFYAAGETLTILGTALGGTTPANDLTITVTEVTSPSGALHAVTSSGTAISAKFVAVADSTTSAAYSTDGSTWTTLTMPGTALSYCAIAYGAFSNVGYYTAIASGTSTAYYSKNGLDWTSTSMPSSTTWNDIAYGNGRFVAITTGASTTAYSTNGTTWTAGGALPNTNNWSSVTYGKGTWVAVASTSSNVGAYSTDGGVTWTSMTMPSTGQWTHVEFGDNMFIAVRTGSTAYGYSVDGITWTAGTLPASVTNPHIAYGQGVFLVTNDNSTTAYTSQGGIVWTSRTLSTGANPISAKHGNPGSVGQFVTIATGTSTVASQTKAGATTKARAYVASNKITEIWVREPGSNYTSGSPTMTITDPNNTGSDATYSARVGNGALAQPMWTNRGTGYTAATATITGDGYADNYQVGTYIGFTGLTDQPMPGSNVQIAGIDDVWYRLVTVTGLSVASDGTYSATLQVSPPIGVAEAPEHLAATTIRIRYSQVRLTGHDFLDIGTGNILTTNYPGLPTQDPVPSHETVQHNGGRVFYTSTDQDGNFRVGGLFNVEQATGIATLNADAFNIAGLNELSLGSVALGGSGATITEFSTDPFFTQDSDSVIPTQRAIKAYITSQIGGGESSLNVNTLTAGVIYIAGQSITTTTGVQININTKVNFKGGIVGDALVLNYFLLNS